MPKDLNIEVIGLKVLPSIIFLFKFRMKLGF